MPEPPANQGNEGTPRPADASTIRNTGSMLGGGVPDPLINRTVGQYVIKQVIGAGGMGTVYEAMQQSPRRSVALKMMRTGISSKNAMRRFEYEAQALGRLRHPNIAQIYEAGNFDDGAGGRPWFAMEMIIGKKELTTYCNEKRLNNRDKLKLFKQICDAVQHGHQKGIIHRDLKPSNILVTSSGVPKIIDFGVARSTDSDMAVTTLQTDVGAIIGTLQYMSPEQCAADPNDIDTRSDIYALGTILYELLCDRLPYDLRRKAIHEAARMVQEVEPIRPSSVDRMLRGDLEVITLKAMEKDRSLRYQSATAMDEDIGRYLNGDSILARAPTAWEQIRRLARKHRLAAISLGSIAVLLVAGILIVSIFAIEADKQRLAAQQARDDADVQRVLAVDEAKAARAAEAAAQDAMLNARQSAYTANIHMARGAATAEKVTLAAESLARARDYLPSDAVPPLEWKWIDALIHDGIGVLDACPKGNQGIMWTSDTNTLMVLGRPAVGRRGQQWPVNTWDMDLEDPEHNIFPDAVDYIYEAVLSPDETVFATATNKGATLRDART
ncbi:MAG: serine/threonine-protein kinase, partial [Planctomycetota bacterium]|nr:serine/threonine-protein kinase [Planctomycetota bacterium]